MTCCTAYTSGPTPHPPADSPTVVTVYSTCISSYPRSPFHRTGWYSPKMRGILLAVLGGLSTAVLAKPSLTRGQDIFDTFSDSLKKDHSSRPAPYDVFVQHSECGRPYPRLSRRPISLLADSLQRAGTDVYLYSKIKEMYPGQAVTVSSDYQFAPLRYAAGASDRVQMRQIEDIEAMKHVYFQKPLRRRDGHGQVVDVLTFGGYTIAWGDYGMTAIIATVSAKGWQLVPHLIQCSGETVRTLTANGTSFRTMRRSHIASSRNAPSGARRSERLCWSSTTATGSRTSRSIKRFRRYDRIVLSSSTES